MRLKQPAQTRGYRGEVTTANKWHVKPVATLQEIRHPLESCLSAIFLRSALPWSWTTTWCTCGAGYRYANKRKIPWWHPVVLFLEWWRRCAWKDSYIIFNYGVTFKYYYITHPELTEETPPFPPANPFALEDEQHIERQRIFLSQQTKYL